MVDLIAELIEKQDMFEIVRDQIAAILAAETVSQVQKAIDDGKTADEALAWAFNVYTERARPWEALIDTTREDGEVMDETPVVNVWFDNGTFPQAQGDTVERQAFDAAFNIDIYAAAISADDGGAGYFSGDETAARAAQRIVRLSRNILMSGLNTYLQLRGFVWRRWPGSITMFQPQLNELPVQNVIAGRFVLNVKFNEVSPQVPTEDLEELAIEIKRAEDGKIIVNTQYDMT